MMIVSVELIRMVIGMEVVIVAEDILRVVVGVVVAELELQMASNLKG